MAVVAGVALFGMAGVLSRYGIDRFIEQRSEAVFPLATFLVNVTGCLAVGFIITAIVDRQRGPHWLHVGLVIGLCGGYTTFSTFAREALSLIDETDYRIALASIAGNVALGIASVWVGARLGQLA